MQSFISPLSSAQSVVLRLKLICFRFSELELDIPSDRMSANLRIVNAVCPTIRALFSKAHHGAILCP
jgi:hypothetical protein